MEDQYHERGTKRVRADYFKKTRVKICIKDVWKDFAVIMRTNAGILDGKQNKKTDWQRRRVKLVLTSVFS